MDQSLALDSVLCAKAAELMNKIDAQIGYHAGLLRAGLYAPAVETLARGGKLSSLTLPPPLGRLRNHSRHDIMTMVHVAAAYRVWRTAPIVHAMDSDITDVVVDSVDDTFSGDLFRHLPYPYPAIVFPQPRVFNTANGLQGALVGLFFYGVTSDDRYCATSDPDMVRLGVMSVSFLTNPRGDWTGWDFVRISVPLAEKMTIEAAVQANLDNFALLNDAGTDLELVAQWVRFVLPVALNTLLYVADESQDHIEMPPVVDDKPRKAPKGKGKDKSNARAGSKRPAWLTQMIASGWVKGPEMRRRRDEIAAQASGTGTGGKQDPQWRRAHKQTYWTGQGRQVKVIRWKMPYETHRDEPGDRTPKVVPVSGRRDTADTADRAAS